MILGFPHLATYLQDCIVCQYLKITTHKYHTNVLFVKKMFEVCFNKVYSLIFFNNTNFYISQPQEYF